MLKNKNLIFIMIAMFVLTMGTAWSQTTWYVDDDNCPGPGSGTSADPFCSIQDAIDAASSGDEVYVNAGTYTEQVALTPGNDLKITGAGRDLVTWIAPGNGKCIDGSMSGYTGSMNYEISGFTFNCRSEAAATHGTGIQINRASNGPLSLKIHNNRFIEDRASGDNSHWATSMLLCHNRYAGRNGSGKPAVRVYSNIDKTWGGLTMSNSQAYDIYNNVFDGCSDAIYNGHGCPDVAGQTFGDHRIYDNTFKNASDNLHPSSLTPAIDWKYYGGGGGTHLASIIEKNKFQNNDTAIRFEMGTNMTYPDHEVRYNNFTNNDMAIRVEGAYASPLNAINNWWDDISGPLDDSDDSPQAYYCYNPTGLGNEVSDNILYCTWLDAVGGDPVGPCQPPIADFTTDPDTPEARIGITELCVQFKNLSKYATHYLWNFGDGTTSTEKNPEHCYYNPPIKHYTVTLTAYAFGNEDTMVKENYITVVKEAEVSFSAYPIVGPPELEVQFTNNCGGNIQHFLWVYGDGDDDKFQHSTMEHEKIHPIHLYTAEGDYTVSLEGWGIGGADTMIVPGMIYVDEDYAPLELVEGSEPVAANTDWDKAIDHNIVTTKSYVSANNGDAWAIFNFADSESKMVHKVRMIANDAYGSIMKVNLTKDFEIWVSNNGVDFSLGFNGTLVTKRDWEIFEFDAILAKYIKLVLVNARGENSPQVTLGEFQVFGATAKTASEKRIQNEAIAGAEVPTDYGLLQNYPNPFNPETTICFQLPEAADVVLNIYNINGQLINTLVNAHKNAGNFNLVWNGRDSAGKVVAGGMYIYSIHATNDKSKSYRFTKKMMFMK